MSVTCDLVLECVNVEGSGKIHVNKASGMRDGVGHALRQLSVRVASHGLSLEGRVPGISYTVEPTPQGYMKPREEGRLSRLQTALGEFSTYFPQVVFRGSCSRLNADHAQEIGKEGWQIF